MRILTLSIIIPILLFSSGVILHYNNLNHAYKKMLNLVGPGVTKESFYKEMTVAQGSNFTALAMSAWIMLFVAIAYLYLLFPGTLPINYMTIIPELASSRFGFFFFGGIIATFAAVVIWGLDMLLPNNYRDLNPSELYSFYPISMEVKKWISLTIIPLGASIIISAYLGTIYPSYDSFAELLSFVFLILPMGILILPIWRGRE